MREIETKAKMKINGLLLPQHLVTGLPPKSCTRMSCVDGGKARIILSALVSPASIMDNTPSLDLIDWTCSRWSLEPKIAVGDAKYGTEPNIVGLEERSIDAYLPTPDLSKRSECY